ncbi:MAG: redoxin domain-containing protein [Candidatus Tectomicrobia bacterium]|uniref:Redoxin domain-containing protein n=1 Tax=Tectimicrobiota bacterium TaxID=2528274 RepID=A0A932I0Z7_UNCTE|nr:redoxin domain-containing protein [Candidatus Tectomicrobia bacterium]
MLARRILLGLVFGALMLPGAAFAQSVILFPDHPQAPGFQLPDLSGKSVSLKGLRGSPVLLAFWQTT